MKYSEKNFQNFRNPENSRRESDSPWPASKVTF